MAEYGRDRSRLTVKLVGHGTASSAETTNHRDLGRAPISRVLTLYAGLPDLIPSDASIARINQHDAGSGVVLRSDVSRRGVAQSFITVDGRLGILGFLHV